MRKFPLRPIVALACAALAPALASSAALAQHADVEVRVSGGRLATDVRVYGYDFQEDPLDPYFASDPGFNAAAGSNLPPGSQLLFNVPGASRFGLPGNLSLWDGTGDVSFAPVPAGETLRLSLGAQSRTIGAATGDVEGFPIATVAGDGSLHRHLNSLLQGSDASTDPTDGIYLLPLALASSDPSVAPSEPLFLVFNNGLSEPAHDAAIEYVGTSIVPEPSAPALAALAGLLGLRRPRRPPVDRRLP